MSDLEENNNNPQSSETSSQNPSNVPPNENDALIQKNRFKKYIGELLAPTSAINIVMIVVTLLLFKEALRQSSTALIATNIADSALKDSREGARNSDSITQKTIKIAENNLSLADSNYQLSKTASDKIDSNTKTSIRVQLML